MVKKVRKFLVTYRVLRVTLSIVPLACLAVMFSLGMALSGTVDETGNAFRFEKKVLKIFTWGSGQNQLGSNWERYTDGYGNHIGPTDAWSESRGPRRIFVDRAGKLLIWDSLNNRTVVYDPAQQDTGILDHPFMSDIMTYDGHGRIYCTSGGTIPGVIRVYDPDYRFKASHEYDNQKHRPRYIQGIHAWDDGTIALLGLEEIWIVDPDKQTTEMKIGSMTRQVLPLEPRKTSVLTRRPGGLKTFTPHSFREIDIAYELQGRYGDAIFVAGEDNAGNVYLLMGVKEKINGVVEYFVHIYSPKGIFLGEIKLEPDDNLFFDQEAGGRYVSVDRKGTIYQLNIQRKGARLISWTTAAGSPGPTGTVGTLSKDLEVDFSNSESRQVSVNIGRSKGLGKAMNFAILNGQLEVITHIYPYEILNNRFWSGSLDETTFSKIAHGMTVVRVDLDRASAARLREEHSVRTSFLRLEREREELGAKLRDIDIEIDDMFRKREDALLIAGHRRKALLAARVGDTEEKEASLQRIEEILREMEKIQRKRDLTKEKFEKTAQDRVEMLSAPELDASKVDQLGKAMEKLSTEITVFDTQVVDFIEDLITNGEVIVEEEDALNERMKIQADLDNALAAEQKIEGKLRAAERRRRELSDRLNRLDKENENLLEKARVLAMRL
jgi:hypothetical protein